MASFLFLAKDLTNAGRVEGDPVSIKDDNDTVTTPSGTWHWTAEEDIDRWVAEGNDPANFPDLFYVVEIPGMPLSAALRFSQPYVRAPMVFEPEFQAPDEADRYVEVGPHRWQLGVADKIPGPARNQLRQNRKITFPYDEAVINSYVIDRAGLDVLITDNPIDP